jgi:hypothetical protein
MDRLSSLSVFVRTVELGSQAAAAAELGLSRTMLGGISKRWSSAWVPG